MIDHVTIVVPGRPIPWSRTGGSGSRRFTPLRQRQHRRHIREHAQAALVRQRPEMPWSGPLEVWITLVYPRPKSKPPHVTPERWRQGHRAPYTPRPDFDNAAKIVMDALEGLVCHNDAQVCRAHVVKVYGGKAEEPRTEVVIARLGELFLENFGPVVDGV